ncbi:dTDP-4-dehydrorhamnose reductase [Oceanisphaera psychrotolerans]|uniref:dTDP-4-dehydrorhamnose reductase n=1 Tax=Oceanisphaera psychrotolerans TaxID=1414654 RepID=A0A1J4QFE5_9GAMM|nr:dTDP-4-dehydrorhamnose reductase [Oceanisphaera psychrotolerans]OIN08003.1 dTDP-4-dehydrorhamnose reductase [Oceanisphaera psychrotolerans]
MSQTILVTGGTGQVGFELQRSLLLHGNILAPSRSALDLYDARAVASWLDTHRPQLIVNAAAYTAVDKAETEQTQASRLNAELPAQLAEYCRASQAGLVHYSSDYVYPGHGDTPWKEQDETGPLNHYGQTKLQGDMAVAQAGINYFIFRTSWVYAAHGNNFMKTMLRLGRERVQLQVVNDQIGSPTPARLIAQVTERALSKNIASGIYHLAPNGYTHWQQFAQAIFTDALKLGEKLAICPGQVTALATLDYPTPAQRPLNSRLNISKLEQALHARLPDWRQQLQLTLKEYVS